MKNKTKINLTISHPDITKQWHPTKNGELKPTDFTAGSNKKIWWICEHGHEWEATIYNRKKGSGCPYCSGRYAIQGITDLATTHPELAKQWHPTKNDNLKPTDVTISSNKKVWWRGKCGHEWPATINSRKKGNGCPYCGNKKVLTGFNDLVTTRPDIAKEWHPTKNDNLKPTDFTAGSRKKVWWKCEHGHEWEAVINNRTRGNSCPYCSHSGTSKPELILLYYIRKYFNVKIEHRYKKFGFEIDIFFYHNNEKIGIEYDGLYAHKNKKIKDINKNKKCEQLGIKLYRFREKPLFPLHSTSIDLFCNPYNYGEFSNLIKQFIFDILKTNVVVDIENDKYDIDAFFKLIKIEESLATNYPKIAKEWHPTKNGNLKPDNVPCGSNEKVWWKCEHGHEWKATVANRTNGNNCPYCSGRYAIQGITDLATTHPDIAKQWHPTKNGELKPTDVSAGSNKKVWWQCEHGHEWEATVASRTKENSGCPYCASQKVLAGFNDLATTHPDIAKQWHPTKNNKLHPTDVTAGSGKKVWWKCEHGHEWEATIYSRIKGSGCPYCAGRYAIQGITDLATTHPELAKQWHPTKNGELKPTDVTAGSGKKVWWIGKCGHEWEATIFSRIKGAGCPICSHRKLLIGYNDLATTHPELTKQWHPTKNGNLKPTDVSAGSHEKVWWKCEHSHEWEAVVINRKKGSGCPYCAGQKVLAGFNDLATTNPDIAKQWHPTKNGELKPTDVTAGSGKKVWWTNEQKGEFQAKIVNRTCYKKSIKA